MPTFYRERFGSDARGVGSGIACGGDFWADRSVRDGAGDAEVHDRPGQAVLFAVFLAAMSDGSSVYDARFVRECDGSGTTLACWHECGRRPGGASCLMR